MTAFERPTAAAVPHGYAEPNVRNRLVDGGLDVPFHRASLSGGASDRGPVLNSAVNLNGAIAPSITAATTVPAVIMHAGSIASVGRLDQRMTDTTALRPVATYCTHNAMPNPISPI